MTRLLASTTLTLAAGFLVSATTPPRTTEAPGSAASVAGPRAIAAGEFGVQILGLAVSRRPTPPKVEEGDAIDLGSWGGTDLTLRVALPGRKILGLDPRASTLRAFADDKGNDLREAIPGPGGGGEAWSPDVDANPNEPHAITVRLNAARTPAPGSLRITVKADLAVRCATGGEATVERPGVSLEEGTRVEAGPVAFRVESVEDAEEETIKSMITFSSDLSFPSTIKAIAFLDPSGAPIGAEHLSDGSASGAGSVRYSQTYGLDRRLARATLKVTYFDGVESVRVPVDLTTGLGF